MSSYVICNSVRLNNPECQECHHSFPHYESVATYSDTKLCTGEAKCFDDVENPKSFRIVKCIPYNEKMDGDLSLHLDRLYRIFKETTNVGW